MLIALSVLGALAGEPEAVVVVYDVRGKLGFTVDGADATELVGTVHRFHVTPGAHAVAVIDRAAVVGTFTVEVGARRERRCRWERATLTCYADIDLDARSEVPPPLVATGESSSGAAFGLGLYGGGIVPGGVVVSGSSGGDAYVGSGTIAVRLIDGGPVEVLVEGRVVATASTPGVLSAVVPSGVRVVAFRRVGEAEPYASGRLAVPGGTVVTLVVEGGSAPRVGEGVPDSAWVIDPR
jgi:hypothetical protein